MPSSRTVRSTPLPSRPGTTPKASRKSEAPDLDETARLPCLTTRAPAAAAMIAAVVEMLIVCAPSPPVPTVSTARSAISMGAACAYISATSAPTSSAVSPLALSASRKLLIDSTSALPLNISRMTNRICSGSKSLPALRISIFAEKLPSASDEPMAPSFPVLSRAWKVQLCEYEVDLRPWPKV